VTVGGGWNWEAALETHDMAPYGCATPRLQWILPHPLHRCGRSGQNVSDTNGRAPEPATIRAARALTA